MGTLSFLLKPLNHSIHEIDFLQEQVQSNKDLDLPTQQELLAQFRCDEIATVALEMFTTQAKSVRKPIEGGKVVEGLGALMQSWKDESLGKRLLLVQWFMLLTGCFCSAF